MNDLNVKSLGFKSSCYQLVCCLGFKQLILQLAQRDSPIIFPPKYSSCSFLAHLRTQGIHLETSGTTTPIRSEAVYHTRESITAIFLKMFQRLLFLSSISTVQKTSLLLVWQNCEVPELGQGPEGFPPFYWHSTFSKWWVELQRTTINEEYVQQFNSKGQGNSSSIVIFIMCIDFLFINIPLYTALLQIVKESFSILLALMLRILYPQKLRALFLWCTVLQWL